MRRVALTLLLALAALLPVRSALAQPVPAGSSASSSSASGSSASGTTARTVNNPAGLPALTKVLPPATTPKEISSTLQIMLLLTVLSLAPAILVLMTSFTRIIIVLGLLRQALATQQLPPNQVLIGLALFMTFVVMAPVYSQIHDQAIEPYLNGTMTQAQAFHTAVGKLRGFMIRQIEAGGNAKDVYLFLAPKLAKKKDLKWADVPTLTLVPAYVVSELKIAFLMGFRIYLPFLIIDMVIASVLISMGMLMLPPVLISLPFKLLLFVLADGWHLVVGTLMRSFS